MAEKAVVFPCASDQLVGILHIPNGPPSEVAVLVVVGGPQYRVGSHRQFTLTARGFAAAGYPVLRFDYRGMGDSTGALRTFEEVEVDIRAAIDLMYAELPELRGVVIFGLCDGASAALMYSVGDRRVLGLLLANPWVRTEMGVARAVVRHYYLQRFLERGLWEKILRGKFNWSVALRSLISNFLTGWRNAENDDLSSPPRFVDEMFRAIQQFDGAILIVLSERDLTAQEFRDLCVESRDWRSRVNSNNVVLQQLEGADHTFSTRDSLHAMIDVSLRWLRDLDPR